MSEQEVKDLPTETKEEVSAETKTEDTGVDSKGVDVVNEATDANTSTTESVKRKDSGETAGEPKKKKKRRTYDDDEPEVKKDEGKSEENVEEGDEDEDADAEVQEEGEDDDDDDDDDDEEDYEGEDDGEDEEEEEDELNEIDTTNIITSGRRTRGKQIDFKDAAAKLDADKAKN